MDGGYYAIKGFDYQIDKNILEILKEEDVNKAINIEQNQDIDTADFVMQVKYKEATKFTPSTIKKPVIQLIDEYKKNNTKKYILYCFFKDFNGYTESTSIDLILGSSKTNYTQRQKKDFKKSFKLIFAPQFEIQLEQTIREIQNLNYNEDESIIFHSRASNFLRNLVVNNSPDKISNRTCKKKELIELFKNDRKVIFENSFRFFKGEEAYFKKMKKDFFTFNNVDKTIRLFILEIDGSEDISELVLLLKSISVKFLKHQLRDIKGEAPYVFFRNIDSQKLLKTKEILVDTELVFKDGYDYLNSEFNLNSIIIKSSKENQVSLKIINSETELNQVVDYNHNRLKEVYQFFKSKPMKIDQDIREVNIEIQNSNELLKII
ncbi:hypothetical protein [Formosa algae]|uniref:Uncharacterized protein n=1 Tax=Formosa algae TaxID=225843 RepID=A0A9X0YHF1_9FLAO|nr:hypothetical protein [Formosa algae]MBP1838890.1 hypothetical protein [Formosa algae]MDQ0333667.1 hypothetical protein [Formosa algae]OEI78854.1 hypothetical protein AST99_16905 [Formosa algae]